MKTEKKAVVSEKLCGLLRSLKDPEKRFRPVAFWFLNHYPEKEELIRQIGEMHGKGFGGLMIHARNGLRGGYLNEHWRFAVETILREARKLGMEVYFYDELHYPSGLAGGLLFELRPKSALRSLALAFRMELPPGGKIDPGPVGEMTLERVLVLLDGNRVSNISGNWRNYRNNTGKTVLCMGFYIHESREYPDYLSKTDMAAFVRLSYRWYAERFQEYLGSVVKGEFTDNSCANFGFVRRSIPWTSGMDSIFERRTGRKLDDVLFSLFGERADFQYNRIVFWRFINELYLETFIIPIEKECRRNHIAATGHYCIEEGISEHVRQLGDRFDQKRHQHIPGVDMLGKSSFEALDELVCGNSMSLAIPMTASSNAFFHGTRVLCECFGLAAGWAMTPAEMRRIGGLLAVLGVDLFVPHGLYYSIAGHRKRECVPDFLHNTLFQDIGYWTLWTGRVCSLSAHSDRIVGTAMLYPVTAQQGTLELGGTGYGGNDRGECCDRIDLTFRSAAEAMVSGGVSFEILDEKLLESASVREGKLILGTAVGKDAVFKTLILPNCRIVGEKALKKLRAFQKFGGLLITLNDEPSRALMSECVRAIEPVPSRNFRFRSNAELDECAFLSVIRTATAADSIQISNSGGKIAVREWSKDGVRFAMLHNHSRNRIHDVEISCPGEALPQTLDLDSLSLSAPACEVSGGRILLRHSFDYGETLLLVWDPTAPVPSCAATQLRTDKKAESIDITRSWQGRMLSCNVLRMTGFFLKKGTSGRVWECSFEVDSMPASLGIALDLEPSDTELRKGIHPFSGYELCVKGKMVTKSRCMCLVNGKPVSDIRFGTRFDRWIYEGDITSLVQRGHNTLEILQPDTLYESNSVPEFPLLFGPFFTLKKRILMAKPLSSLSFGEGLTAGYSGTVRFTREVILPRNFVGCPLVLTLEEVRETVRLRINGTDGGIRVMPPWRFEIPARCSANGRLLLELDVANTPFNQWCGPRKSGVMGTVRLETSAAPGIEK